MTTAEHSSERTAPTFAAHRECKPFRLRPTLGVAALALGSWVGHATAIAEDPRNTFSTAALVCGAATLPPILMALGILLMTVVAAVLLSPFFALAKLQRRPSGLGPILTALARPGLEFVPGYVAAWRRAASPLAIGGLAGSLLAIPLLVAISRGLL